jgi:hypothetical protein
MSEIEFWSTVLPSSNMLVSVSWDCIRLFGVMWFLLMLASMMEAGLHGEEVKSVMQPKPAKLSCRERRRAKRQRLDGKKRRWKKGLRAPR